MLRTQSIKNRVKTHRTRTGYRASPNKWVCVHIDWASKSQRRLQSIFLIGTAFSAAPQRPLGIQEACSSGGRLCMNPPSHREVFLLIIPSTLWPVILQRPERMRGIYKTPISENIHYHLTAGQVLVFIEMWGLLMEKNPTRFDSETVKWYDRWRI